MIDIYDARGKLCEEPTSNYQPTDADRIDDAIDIAWAYSAHPGDGAARFVIDRMARALLGPDAYDKFVSGWEAAGSQEWDRGMLP